MASFEVGKDAFVELGVGGQVKDFVVVAVGVKFFEQGSEVGIELIVGQIAIEVMAFLA